MAQTLSEWTTQLAEDPLPAMALTVHRVNELLDNPNSSNSDFQRIISQDPGFSLAIFRGIQPPPASTKEPPHTLSHAIAILGHALFHRIMKSVPVLKKAVRGTPRDRLYHCYSRALHAASYAWHWAHERRDDNPEELRLAALFYDCGEMALWHHAPEVMVKIEDLMAKGLDRGSASRRVLGFTLNELSVALVEQWRLPDMTANALRLHWQAQTRPMEVVLAAALARATEQGWRSEETRDLTHLFADLRHISEDHAAAALHSLAAETARGMEDLPLPRSAEALITLPPAARQPSAAETKAAPAQKTETGKGPATKAITLQDHFGQAMRRMQKEAGLNRVMFAILSKDRKAAKVRFVLGAHKESPLRRFSLPLSGRNLFAVLLSKPQGFWFHETNRDKYLPLIPESIRETIDTRAFFAMSLYVRNKPIGFLYGDSDNPGTLNQDGFNRFKQLSLRLCNHLGQGK